jgi:hypothetical protein
VGLVAPRDLQRFIGDVEGENLFLFRLQRGHGTDPSRFALSLPEIPSRFFEHNAELQCRRGEADRGEISDWRNVGLHGTEPLPLMLAWSQKRTAVAGVISLFMMHRF